MMDFAGYTYVTTAAVVIEIVVILVAFKRRPIWAIYAHTIKYFFEGAVSLGGATDIRLADRSATWSGVFDQWTGTEKIF